MKKVKRVPELSLRDLPIYLLQGHGLENVCRYEDMADATDCPVRPRVPPNTYLVMFEELGRFGFLDAAT